MHCHRPGCTCRESLQCELVGRLIARRSDKNPIKNNAVEGMARVLLDQTRADRTAAPPNQFFFKETTMRKTLMSALVASAIAASSAAMAGPLSFDLNGSAAGGQIVATSLDWAPTSFLALNGKNAIGAFLGGGTGSAIEFDVLTHAKLTAYNDAAGDAQTLPGFGGEITVVSRFTERVTAASAANATASFQTTGAGWVEIYYSAVANSNALRGANFNDGTLILRADGVSLANGSFTVNTTKQIVLLDQSGNGNQYGPTDVGAPNTGVMGSDQLTVQGEGSQGSISFGGGAGGIQLDGNFFKTSLRDFSLMFQNISINLPYGSVDPSDCFNPTKRAALGTGFTTQCNATNHTDGTYAANKLANSDDGGYVPVVGDVNGLFTGPGGDFVAQTDFNSAVTGTVPEPGMLALLGLAFAGLGVTTMRRRRA